MQLILQSYAIKNYPIFSETIILADLIPIYLKIQSSYALKLYLNKSFIHIQIFPAIFLRKD